MVQISSINANGLQNNCKRKELFLYLKKLQDDVIFVQETHCMTSIQNMWRNEWGGQIIFSHGENDARGVMIMFKPNLKVKCKQISYSVDGRYLICDVNIEGQDLMLVNVYAPNCDRPSFFIHLFEVMSEHSNVNRVVGGDFNLVLNPNHDSVNRKCNNKKAAKIINMYMEESLLVDIWRSQHKNERRYTHFRTKRGAGESLIQNKKSYARLDFFLVDYALTAQVNDSNILPSYKTDHAIVKINISEMDELKRGKGIWKLNTSIIRNMNSVNRINSVIEAAKGESLGNTPHARWEHVKEQCIIECKNISKENATKNRKDFNDLKNRLMQLADEINECTRDDIKHSLIDQQTEAQKLIEDYIETKARGARVRSKCRWYESGEIGSKYFLGLERTKSCNKTLKAVMCDDNSIARNNKKILFEQRKYYQKLYARNPEVVFHYINEGQFKSHSEEEHADLNRKFEIDDFKAALKAMKENKSPGLDGLPCEFYKVFFVKIGELLWESTLYSHEIGYLNISARKGMISLIPKKNKDPLYIKNWRPLTLLNIDHKIVSKMIANRLKEHIASIIGVHQTGYVPGRFIGINLRKIIDLLGYLEKEKQVGILLLLDFEKCFDSVAHDSLYKAMSFFNVGDYLISWVKVLYENFQLCVTNNGYISGFFKQEKGLHQGCSLSGPAFLYCGELLAVHILNNRRIKGIDLGDGDIETLEQYADDTSIISRYEEDSIEAIIEELEKLYKNTGLKVNYEKSVIVPVGDTTNRKRMYLSKKFKWETGKINILGLNIDMNDLNDLGETNIATVIEKCIGVMHAWQNRNISLDGKITVVNTLVASLFVYMLQVIPSPSAEAEKKIRKIIAAYVWNGRKAKIKLDVLCEDKINGGRRLANIRCRDASLKVQWIQRMYGTDPILTKLAYYHINAKIRNTLLWECNLRPEDVRFLNCKNAFWNDVVYSWASVNYCDPIEIKEIATRILWYNSNIRRNGRPFFIKEMYEAGILYVKDLYYNGRMLTFEEIQELYSVRVPALMYNAVVSAIPNKWKNVLKKGAISGI